MGKKFKKGDRVRYAHNEGTWIEFQLNSWNEGVVAKDSTDDDVLVRFTVCEELDKDEIELIKPADTKADFLSELKCLLEKYDAGIKVDFDQSDDIYTTMIYVGGDSVKYDFTNVVDKYNIMDYNK